MNLKTIVYQLVTIQSWLLILTATSAEPVEVSDLDSLSDINE